MRSVSGRFAPIRQVTPVFLDNHAVRGEGKLYCFATAAVGGAAGYRSAGLVCAIPGLARVAVFAGDMVAGGHSKHVGGNYDCAETQYTQGDQYYIHCLQ
jgi:hypothetical protein